MNTTTIGIVCLGVGAAVGGASVYFFIKTKCEKRADEEIAAIREYYKEQLALKCPQTHQEAPESTKSDVDEDGIVEFAKMYSEAREAINYNGYYSQAKETSDNNLEDDIVDEDGNNISLSQDLEDEYDPNKPTEIITAEDYGNNGPMFEAVELMYYTQDDVLAHCENGDVTDKGMIIDDQFAYVGNCMIDSGFDHNSALTMYVRNYRLGLDILINKENSFYNGGE